MTLSRLAKAKVNLFLHITGKRDDGYHLLESLVCFPNCGDVLDVAPSNKVSLHEAGPYAGQMGGWQDNLILKAAKLLKRETGVTAGAEIHITKNLPVASGIGGGSTDAATVLHLLCDLWNIEISTQELARLGVELGADLPVCLYGRPAMMSGIGEIISPVEGLPTFGILLVNPGVGVSTQRIFKELGSFAPNIDFPSLEGLNKDSFIQVLKGCRNDMQIGAIRTEPSIEQVLKVLEGVDTCLLSRMSGSGATCFGLFDSAEQAELARDTLLTKQPTWWAMASQI